MFDLVVKTHLCEWRPKRPLAADEVPAYVKDALGMLGRAVPAEVADPGFPTRLAELDKLGRRELTVDGDVTITIRHAP